MIYDYLNQTRLVFKINILYLKRNKNGATKKICEGWICLQCKENGKKF